MSIKKIFAAAMTAGVMLSFIPMTSLADSTGWYHDVPGWRYYTLEDGFVSNTWKKIDGKWYFFNHWEYMIADAENYLIEDKYYDFSSSGECLNPDGKTNLSAGWNKVSYSAYDYSANTLNIPKVFFYWTYTGSDGELYKGWHSIGGKWYYFNEVNGAMAECNKGDNPPYYVDSVPYFFKENSGEMLTGWINDGSNWYYARPNGSLYENEWLFSGGKWYYFGNRGAMIYNAENYMIKNVYYSFDSNGVCINPSGTTDLGTGWVKKSKRSNEVTWYYYDEQGKSLNKWNKIDGRWYYFNDGAAKGRTYIDRDFYFFNDNCQMVTGWFKYTAPNNNFSWWSYAGSNGVIYTNKWLYQGGKWYYFNADGMMLNDVENIMINGKYYSFDSNGVCKNPSGVTEKITGWIRVCSGFGYGEFQPTPSMQYTWHYYDSNGEMYKEKWLNYAGKWYYFDMYGKMVNFEKCLIQSEGKVYDFDKNGVCMNPDNPRVSNSI